MRILCGKFLGIAGSGRQGRGSGAEAPALPDRCSFFAEKGIVRRGGIWYHIAHHVQECTPQKGKTDEKDKDEPCTRVRVGGRLLRGCLRGFHHPGGSQP